MTLRFDIGWKDDTMERRDKHEGGQFLDVADVAEVLRDALEEFEPSDEGGTPYDAIHWIAHKLDMRI